MCILYGDQKRLGTEGHEWQPVLQPAGSAAFRLVVPLGVPRKQGECGRPPLAPQTHGKDMRCWWAAESP